MLSAHEAEAVVAIALMSALADGRSDPAERDQIRSLFESLDRETELTSLAQLHQRVVLNQTTLEAETARLTTDDARRMAFELAVCVADADGSASPKEQAFLDRAERLLGLDHAKAMDFEQRAESIARAEPREEQRLTNADLIGEAIPPVAAAQSVATALSPSGIAAKAVDPRTAETDRITLRYAMLNGALELLPQNLATMAILPLQVRMVYAIGKQHGFALDAGHIKEFIATLGLGATSQMLENFARKALDKFIKKTLGKTAAKIASATTGPMLTFATTYAIGQVASAYYAGGRKLSSVDLRNLFERHLTQGKAMYDRVQPQIESHARNLDPGKVLDLVRGKASVLA